MQPIEHVEVKGVFLVQMLVLSQGYLQLQIEVPEDAPIEDGGGPLSEHIEGASQRNEEAFELGDHILPETAGADAVASAVVAVPIFILEDVIHIIFVIGAQTVGAKFAIARILLIQGMGVWGGGNQGVEVGK